MLILLIPGGWGVQDWAKPAHIILECSLITEPIEKENSNKPGKDNLSNSENDKE